MAIYYANMIAMRSDLEREAERHRETRNPLREAKEMRRANRASRFFLPDESRIAYAANAVIGFSEILLEGVESGRQDDTKNLTLNVFNGSWKAPAVTCNDVA